MMLSSPPCYRAISALIAWSVSTSESGINFENGTVLYEAIHLL